MLVFNCSIDENFNSDEFEDVTETVDEHFEYNGWDKDNPDYEFSDAKAWEGGMGTNLYFCKITNRYLINL